MPKSSPSYVCTSCDKAYFKPQGKCFQCGEFGTVERVLSEKRVEETNYVAAEATPVTEIQKSKYNRIELKSSEINRVLGGGFLEGSVVLLSGSPGIGKSSILTQVSADMAEKSPVLYASAEESESQVKYRVDRFSANNAEFYLMPENNLDAVLDQADKIKPGLIVVDSIQTVYTDDVDNSAGSMPQIRECSSQLVKYAKRNACVVVIVGHVTKDNSIAGPRMLEHVVDTVLYLEGDSLGWHRIIRAVKNRFGSTNEVGVLEMREDGLRDVENPSEVFLRERNTQVAGSCIGVTLEGTRPIMVEVQALVTETEYSYPQVNATGFDRNRLNNLSSALAKSVDKRIGRKNITINIVGGLMVKDTAVDMPVVMAVLSSYFNIRLPAKLVAIGEVGILGEVRSAARINHRIEEVIRSGYDHLVVPVYTDYTPKTDSGVKITKVKTVGDLVQMVKRFDD